MRFHRSSLVLAAALAVVATAAVAQEDAIGKQLFDDNCAACHGTSARGDGDMAGVLTIPAPDLTVLKQNNNGSFPAQSVIDVVDGRKVLRGHGGAMPIFAGTFGRAMVSEHGSTETELMVRGRILSIVLYLESLQR